MGQFVVTERIGNMAYHLDLSQHAVLRGFHDVFHVSLLYGWLTNGVHANVPSIKTDGKAEYKIADIKVHHQPQGKM